MSASQNRSTVMTACKAPPLIIESSPMPTPEGSEILIEVEAVAMNPADWAVQEKGIILDPEKDYPMVPGCDAAGVVVAVGPDNQRFQVGDRVVSSSIQYTTRQRKHGAFQQYMVCTEPLVARVPDNVTSTQACVLPLALVTAAYGIFMPGTLELGLPGSGAGEGKIILVWGGSSCVGANAIQMARAAGYKVVATASAHNFGLLRGIGVEDGMFFDHRKEDVVADVVAAIKSTGLSFAGAFGAVFDLKAACEVVDQIDGVKKCSTVYVPGIPYPEGLPAGVALNYTLSTHIRDHEVGLHIWNRWLTGALADGSMKCKPDPEVVGKGLESVQTAIDLIGKGVSGKKLVVEL